MKVINNSDSEFKIYGNHVNVYEQLPAQTYIIDFDQMQGFVLKKHAEIEIKEEKVYGVHVKKVNKVMKTFKSYPRSLGIILSGDRGMGKSLCSRMLCQAAIEKGYPVVIVDEYIPGINKFIEEIEQEVVLMFDEFDKTFRGGGGGKRGGGIPRGIRMGRESVEDMGMSMGNDNGDPQAAMLSLFDGMASGKKMFIITCNEIHGLNEHFINRPGRFHYHLRFDYPTGDEVREYLQDKLEQKYWHEIPKVISFAAKVKINYDCLRAIAWEISQDETFESAIRDLNIMNTAAQFYDVVMYFTDGSAMFSNRTHMDLFNTEGSEFIWLEDNKGRHTGVCATFPVSMTEYEEERKCYTVTGSGITLTYDDMDIPKDDREKIKSLVPAFLTVSKAKGKTLHYEM